MRWGSPPAFALHNDTTMIPTRSRATTKRRRLSYPEEEEDDDDDGDKKDRKGRDESDCRLKEIIKLNDRKKRISRRLVPTTASPRPGDPYDYASRRRPRDEGNERFKHEQPAPEEMVDRNMAQYIENRLLQTTETPAIRSSSSPSPKQQASEPAKADEGQEVVAGKLHEYNIALLEKPKPKETSRGLSKNDPQARDSEKEQREKLVDQVLKESSFTTSYLAPAFDRDSVQDVSALEQQLKEQEIQRLHWNIEQNLRRRAGAAARARRGGGSSGRGGGRGGSHSRRGASYGVR